MPYIGKNPVGGGFHKLDNLTASATDTYALTLGSAAYYPESANQLLVSLNGVIQAPQDSFTVSGSDLVFDSALTASDSIDFVVALGDVLAVKTVTDGAITANKIGTEAVTTAKIQDGSVTTAKLDTPIGIETTSSTFKMTDLTSNAFYRTGTFTPEFSSTVATDPTAGILTGTYGSQIGEYTRVGDLVHVDILVKAPSTISYTNGGASGQLVTIVGLPFRIKNLTNYFPAGNFGSFNGWNWVANSTPTVIGVPNTKTVYLMYTTATASTQLFTTNVVLANAQTVLSLTYLTDEA